MTTPADAETVRAWWRRWPEANVAIATGAVSGLAVIDVDPRHGGAETLAELESRHETLPDTLESLTGGGGRHLWFRLDGEAVPSVELGPGVELKAERGLIVAPPSLHSSGDEYRWARDAEEMARLPQWLAELGRRHGHRQGAHDQAPSRTATEREEFRELWMMADVEISPGEAYYLCPFHDDHHPSLHIDADGCRWYCFACRIGGGTGRLRRQLGLSVPRPERARRRGQIGEHGEVTLEGETTVDVVGESFHQDELYRLAGESRPYGGVDLEADAELIPIEGDGIEVRIEGRSVGFLSSDDAGIYHDRMVGSIRSQGVASCRARIRGGWDRGPGDVGLFGVTLLMPEE